MKTTIFPGWAGVTVLAIMATGGFAAEPVMRDAATHDQIALTMRKADQADPMKKLPVSKGKDPSVENRPKDLISQSDIISYQGVATLVPKSAILRIPKNYRDRIAMQPGAHIVGWADFYAANRGWITTVEVSRTQAEGNLALPDEAHKQITKSGNLVVATFLGGPISVLPLKKPGNTGANASEGAAEPATTDNSKP